MKINPIYKLALGTLAGLILALGIAYATKPGNCPTVRDYRLDRTHSIGVVYAAWMERMDAAIRDYHSGNISYIMPTGNAWEIYNMKRHAIESSVPENRIIEPVTPSRNTVENITSAVNTIRQRGLPTDLRHYSSDEHLPRIRMIMEKSNADPENDDYNNRLLGIPNSREWVACIRDRRR